MTTGILELVEFKIIAGKKEADLALTQEGVNDFLKEQAGFMYRSISKCDDGKFVDVVYWDSLELAQNASDALMKDSRGQAMIALCDMESVRMQHLPILSEAMMSDCKNEI